MEVDLLDNIEGLKSMDSVLSISLIVIEKVLKVIS